jgi:branched-chain amino acid transport system ATP-binding protein
MLEIADLRVAYDTKQVLHGVSLAVAPGRIVGLVGHNGAGKTTLLRAALGLVRRNGGTIRFMDREVRPGATAALVRAGLCLVPEGRGVFRQLSVADNLAIAAGAADGTPIVTPDAVLQLFPVLAERRDRLAQALSGGQQQMLAIASALLRAPRLVLLDEPSTGLAPVLVDEVFATIASLRDRFGLGVLVVDQNVNRLLALCDELHVMKAGEIVFAGPPAALGGIADLWKLF